MPLFIVYSEIPQNFVLTAIITLSYIMILSVRNVAIDQLDDYFSLHGISWAHLEMLNWWST